jgi:hypothetical protein
MIPNTIKAFLFHVILCIVGYAFLLVTDTQFLQQTHRTLLVVIDVIMFLVICSLYVLMARKSMQPKGTFFKNLISVSAVSIVLLLLAIGCTIISTHPTKEVAWAMYLFPNFSFGFILMGQDDRLFLLLAYLFAFFPSLLMALGISMNKQTHYFD